MKKIKKEKSKWLAFSNSTIKTLANFAVQNMACYFLENFPSFFYSTIQNRENFNFFKKANHRRKMLITNIHLSDFSCSLRHLPALSVNHVSLRLATLPSLRSNGNAVLEQPGNQTAGGSDGGGSWNVDSRFCALGIQRWRVGRLGSQTPNGGTYREGVKAQGCLEGRSARGTKLLKQKTHRRSFGSFQVRCADLWTWKRERMFEISRNAAINCFAFWNDSIHIIMLNRSDDASPHMSGCYR